MIETVMFFAAINIIFEFIVLSLMAPKVRLRLLGNQRARYAWHTFLLVLMLWFHWGTVTGTMAATLTFITSMLTTTFAQGFYGTIRDGKYNRGLVGYTREELI